MSWSVYLFFLFSFSVLRVSGREAPNADILRQLKREGRLNNISEEAFENALRDVPDLIRYHGYTAEVHHVTTEDGYILELHRVPYGNVDNSTTGRIPVFLMHGLLSSSFSYVLLGPEDSLTYYLAERGYDVWLGNARGNYYSRAHVSLSPEDVDFWRFSWEEFGEKDMPAVVDYILENTGQERLHYVGHSQGGTTFLVFGSTKPEYNDKIISFQGLAPASYFQNFDFDLLKNLAPFEHILETMAFDRGVAEIAGMSELPFIVSDVLCSYFGALEQTCIDFILNLIDTEDLDQDNELVAWMGHSPGGISIRQLAHYGQSINSGRFARYDYRGIDNWFRYNAWTSPEFDLSLIATPSYIHYTLNDVLVNYNDVFILGENLGNLAGLYQVSRTSFDHANFVTSHDAKELVYDLMYELMKEAENK